MDGRKPVKLTLQMQSKNWLGPTSLICARYFLRPTPRGNPARCSRILSKHRQVLFFQLVLETLHLLHSPFVKSHTSRLLACP